MKRIISFSLLIVFLISLAGCGKSSENTESTEQSKATSQSVTSTNTENTTEKKATESSTTKPTEKKGKLSGFKVLLDAGHGCSGNYVEPKYKGASDSEVTYENSSTGATGVVTKKREGDLTLEIALKLQKKLNHKYKILFGKTRKTPSRETREKALPI